MPSTATTWSLSLYNARKALHLTRPRLARLAGVSASTVKSYETGRRQPTRIYLVAILDALRVERHLRNEIMVGAGFAPDGEKLGSVGVPHYMFSPEDAARHIEEMPWPCFVLNEYTEVVAANRLTELLWDIDLRKEFPDPLDRNMISVASNPRFAGRVENWEETMMIGIGVFKGHHRGAEDIDKPNPYFAQVLERFMKGRPEYVGRLVQLWQQSLPRDPKVRWEYEVHWNEPGIGRMRFLAVVNTASEPNGLAFNDWIPVGANTWNNFEALQKRGPGRRRKRR